jgi:PAS domain S-box-containing protein
MSLSTHSPAAEILLVDDDPASLDLLAHLFKLAGHRVRAAPSPELALQSALSFPPELIILDVRMPGMDGFEVARQLKQNQRTATIPIIFISGQTDVSDRVLGFEVGGVDFIIKPFQREEVLARVQTHLMLRKAQEEINAQNKILEARVQERTADLIRERDMVKCYIEDAPVGIFITDTNGRYLDVNPAGCELTGYSRAELLGMTIANLAPTKDRLTHLELFAQIVQQGGGSIELSLRQKNGHEILVSLKAVLLDDRRVMGFCSDITEQRRSALQAVARSQELDRALQQLHSLSAHMHDSIEEERMTIASDIHDQIGASLTGANLMLNQLNLLAPDLPAAGRAVLAQVQEIVSQTLVSSRGVYTRLRPPMLNDLGLAETCRWYLQDWAQKSGIQIRHSLFRLPNEPSESIRLDIFRILQELLTNVVRHSSAKQVSISLTHSKNYILLKVRDNGQGFDPEHMHEGFGLQGIKGRLNRHQGAMQIDRASPGMSICVQIPHNPLNNNEVK